MLKRPASPADLPKSVPVFPLTGALLLPFSHRPLNVFEPRYIDMVDAALRGDRLIGLIQPEDTSEESPKGRSPLQSIGCLGRLTHFEESGEGRYFIILEGITRFKLMHELTVMTPYRQCVIDATGFAADFEREYGEAAEALVTILRKDRTWNEYVARKKLLDLFEAWGPKDPATLKGRRLLSAALFS